MSTLAFSEKVRENAAIQAQLADLFVDALEYEHIKYDLIREVQTRLSVAIDLAKDSEKL